MLRRHAPSLTPEAFLGFNPGSWIQYFDDTAAKDPAKALSTPAFDRTSFMTTRHVKYFASADLLCFLDHSPGVPVVGFMPDGSEQTVGACGFVRGITGEVGIDHAIPLAEVDPVILSEVLRLMEVLREKGAAPAAG